MCPSAGFPLLFFMIPRFIKSHVQNRRSHSPEDQGNLTPRFCSCRFKLFWSRGWKRSPLSKWQSSVSTKVASTGHDIPKERCEAERRQEACVPVRDTKRRVSVSAGPVLGIPHDGGVKRVHRLRTPKIFLKTVKLQRMNLTLRDEKTQQSTY